MTITALLDAPTPIGIGVSAEQYQPAGGQAYAPAAFAFHCRPAPVEVTPALRLPQATATADGAIRAVLQQQGLSAAQVSRFERDGLPPLRPIAAAFGADALAELFRRLRYDRAQILTPPTTDDSPRATVARLGVVGPPLLTPRLLLAIPGHFRELARRSPRPSEAFVLETLGWLVMRQLRDAIETATRLAWWLPPVPAFVGPFPTQPIRLSPEVQALIRGPRIVDAAVTEAQLRARFRAWRDGLPGRAWRLETGRETSAAGAGRPFYPELAQVPAAVDLEPARRRILPEWDRQVRAVRVADEDARTNALVSGLPSAAIADLFGNCQFRGLGIARAFPQRAADGGKNSVQVLRAVEPVFGAVFETVRALGWNDLVFHTGGAWFFRGRKVPRSRVDARLNPASARVLSNHGLGLAVDFNTFETRQHTAGSLDPRIVAVFETFRFVWGRCFPTPDAMHFEYCGAGCPRR